MEVQLCIIIPTREYIFFLKVSLPGSLKNRSKIVIKNE